MENYVCVSEQQWGMFADCLGSFERKEHAIRRSGTWGEIVRLSGPDGWEPLSGACALIPSACARACWQQPGKHHLQVFRNRRILRCVAFKNFFLAQTGRRIVKTVAREWLFRLDGEMMAGITVNLRSRESPEVTEAFITSDWCRSVPCTWLRLHRFSSSRTTETRLTTGHGRPWVRARQIWRTDPSDTTGEMKKYRVRQDAQK